MAGEPPPSPGAAEEPTPWALLIALALPPLLLSVALVGQAHQDEVFQFTEPAMRVAFGVGVTTWEWTEGIRNYVVVGVLAGLLKACAAVGLESVLGRRLVLALPQALLHLWVVTLAWAYLRRRGASRWPLVAFTTWGVFWAVGARTLSESLSVPFLVAAFCHLDPLAPARPRRAFWVGVWWACAVVVRYGSLAFLPAVLLLVLRRWGPAGLGRFLLGAALPLGALGLVDALTWGAPWASLLNYLSFNLGPLAAERFGAAPWYAYGPWLVAKLPAWALVGLGLWAWPRAGARAGGDGWALALPGVYLAALLVTAHKEARFLMPALALLCLWSAGVWASWLGGRTFSLRWRWAAVVLLLGSNAATYFLFPKEGLTPRHVVLCHAARLTAPGARGVLLVDVSTWSSCGSLVFGKDVAWRAVAPADELEGALEDPAYDVVIFNGVARLPPGFEERATRVFDQLGVVAFRRAR